MPRRLSSWTNMIRPAAMLLFTILLFVHMSYSWIRREWTPSIAQDGIKITTSGSLVFQMGNDSDFSDSQTINEILNVTEFVLKPVSNCSGESTDFFTLNFNESIGFEKFQHLNITSAEYKDFTDMGYKNGYLEFTFVLHSPDGPPTTRYIYLEEAYIRDALTDEASAASCVRVSITNKSTNKTIIFGECTGERMAISNEKDGSGHHLADNALLYSYYDPSDETKSMYADKIIYKNGDSITTTEEDLLKHQEVRSFSEVSGRGADGSFDPNKVLFSMASGSGAQGVTLTIRIWLEGSDPSCSASISAQEIDLKLTFAAFTAEELP